MKSKSIFDTHRRLYEITKSQASELFHSGIVIYIQTGNVHLAPECYNTFMLCSTIWDASLNIYTGYLTPEEYGFDNILSWIGERINIIPNFYTYKSTELLNIDNN